MLRGDPLRHIVTLKMLSAYGAAMQLRFAEDDSGWALVSELPLGAFPYDAATYGTSGLAVLVDGTSAPLKLSLLQALPRQFLVVKTYDAVVQRYATAEWGAEHVATFLSFTTDTAFAEDPSVKRSTDLSMEAAKLFASNGYTDQELWRAFDNGACWFGVQRDEQLASACFVFQNFDRVWEIAGVATEPAFRRQHLAATVVRSAVNHLIALKRLARYQVAADNVASVQLARAAGLHEFIRIEHHVVAKARAR